MMKLDAFKMKTSFHGLIKLLADGLYSEPDVFIRELIQNSCDSIVRRMVREPNLAGRIDIITNTSTRTISVIDNGIGMDEQDIRDFLSVIGSSGTRLVQNSETYLPHDLIGQFGIGLLSTFVVAEKVYVNTLKIGTTEAYEWQNTGSDECQLYLSDKKTVGSEITLYIQDNFTYFLSENKLKETIIRYCDFIPIPIFLNQTGPINSVEAPWNKVYPNSTIKNDAYYNFIERRFTDFSMDVFSFSIDGPYCAKGILYISDRHIPGVNTGGVLDVFIRQMLVKQADTTLLPPWAQFIRGVIDSPDLKPTAARDNIQTAHKSFEYIRNELGRVIVQHLAEIANTNPKLFQTINEWHHYYLKGMAYFYDDFFNEVADLLLFDTNQGMMSLHDYLPKNDPLPDGYAPIYYFSYDDASAQFYRLANSKNIVVINGGDHFDEEILKKYSHKYDNRVKLQQLDVLSNGIFFVNVSDAEIQKFSILEQEFTYALNRSGLNVKVDAKYFIPESIPAIIIETERSQAEEKLRILLNSPRIRMGTETTWSEVLDDQHKKLRKLVINAGNPVINGLFHITTPTDHQLLESLLIGIYNNAMLYSHRMRAKDMDIVHDSMAGMMERVILLYNQKAELTLKVEENRRKGMKEVHSAVMPDYIRIFMITPFSSEFCSVEYALREVLESAPFFFQVRLARDYIHQGGMLVNDTRQHIAESHGFVADITGLNPNVMMELGAIFMRKDHRPVLVMRAEEDTSKIPADLGDKLRISYHSNTDSVERISTSIRQKLINNGTIIREDLNELIRKRKARYLSRTLLKHLPHLNLTNDDISNICGKYETVEELLKTSNDELRTRLGLKEFVVQGLIVELKEMIEYE